MMPSTQFIVTVRSLIHSQRSRLITAHPPGWYSCGRGRGLQERVLQRAGLRRQLVQTRCSCAASSPTSTRVGRARRACGRRRSRPWRRPARSGCDQVGASRALHPHPAVGVASDEVVDRGLLDQPALPDDDEVVGHQRHLAELVAADQHGAALPGEVREHVADPADAFGVEAVGGLVEDDRVRVAEQHTGEPEPLAHAQRVAAHALAGDRR